MNHIRLDGAPKTKGRNLLAKHLAGKRLTQRQAIVAKCCDCMGYHIDGREDCAIPTCPLYPWMPHRSGIDSTAVERHQAHGLAEQVPSDVSGEGGA